MTEAQATPSNHSSPITQSNIPLPESEQQFRAVLEASPDGFLILRSMRDAAGTITDFIVEYANPVAARGINPTPEEFLGQYLWQLLPECQTNGMAERCVAVAETGIATTFETCFDCYSLRGWFRIVIVQINGGIAISFSNITDRKQAELLLQQQDQHFRVALQTAKLGSWEHNLTTGVLTCSAQCKANFGLPPDAEFTHETLFAALHPDDRLMVQAAIQHAIENRADYDVEERCYHPDGSLHWLIVRGQLVCDSKGVPIRLVGVTLDITPLKQAEETLRQSEERLRIAQQAANAGVWDWEITTNQVTWSEEYYRLYGLDSATSPSYENWLNSVVEQDRERANRVVQAALKDLVDLNVEFRILHPTQGERWLVAIGQTLVDSNGHPTRMTGIILDITHRKQAEKTLQRYQLLSEHSRDIVLYLNKNGQILEANQAAEKAYGYTRTEFLTLKITDLRTSETLPLFSQQFEQASQRGILFETTHQRKDGSQFPVEVSAQSAIIDGESVVLSIIRDITERKQVEQEQERLLGREQETWEAAKTAEQRARFLAEASNILSSSLDFECTLRSVAQAVVPTLADWCAVDLLKEDGTLERLATTHIDPAKVQWGMELYRRYPPDLNAPRGIAQVLRTGQSEYYPTISDEQIVAAARDAEHLEILRDIGFSSAMLVPLKARGKTLGVISFIAAESGRSYSLDDLSLAEELSHRAAIALDNAHLYQKAQQARKTAEHAADRTARLQAVTAALSESLTPIQVAEVIVEQSVASVEADAALMVLLSEGGTQLEIVRTVGYDISPDEDYRRFPIDSPLPLAEAVRTGNPVWSEPLAERLTRYPHLAEIYKRLPFQAWISLPLTVQGKAVGGLSLSFKKFKLLNQGDRDFILALTRQCAQAIVRAQLYEAEQQARAEAEQANRIKDEFLAVLSHELRSPLNPILGWSSLLQTRKFDEQSTKRALETIERNAKLQTQLIDDLLDVSRILRGKTVLDVSLVNLETVIDAALETVRLSAEAKNINIQKTIADNRGFVSGDSGRLQQIVWNLLSNAIKFTPPGGQIAIRLDQKDGIAQLQVKDTGKGIAPEFLPYVFEYFRQEDGTITRKFGGLGLGLAIARYLTELHGGTVKAESPGEGQGATFTIRLPLQNSEPGEEEAQEKNLSSKHSEFYTQAMRWQNQSTETPHPLLGLRVLVVDDEADMRDLIFTILKPTGATIISVSSATEALVALQSSRSDILISDVGMPDIDGYELIRQVRRLPPDRGGQIPAIALTAYAGEMNQQQALAAGFQKHISKPVEPQVLVQTIHTLYNPLKNYPKETQNCQVEGRNHD